MKNLQIKTTWKNKNQKKLKTSIVESNLPRLKQGEILVEMLYVPIHGSFWLASHPNGLHPRLDEFMSNNSFVFGNGGVGRIVQSKANEKDVRNGDYVCIYGHVPCAHYDCYACTVLHRYTECDYGEGTILGHGKGSYSGTFANYVVLPKYSFEVCYRENENPKEEQLIPFMFAFLFADIRNALTRHPDTLRSSHRMLLFGAGYSAQIAAYLHSKSCPESKIFVVESSEKMLEQLVSSIGSKTRKFLLPNQIVQQLNNEQRRIGFRHELNSIIKEIEVQMIDFFDGRTPNLLFDASSGNTAPLWDNNHILAPTTHCIPFGFASEYILLNKEIIQMSGLSIMMSRGVGNIRNRKEVIELIKSGAHEFIESSIIKNSKRLIGIQKAISFIKRMQEPPRSLEEINHSYIDFQNN